MMKYSRWICSKPTSNCHTFKEEGNKYTKKGTAATGVLNSYRLFRFITTTAEDALTSSP